MSLIRHLHVARPPQPTLAVVTETPIVFRPIPWGRRLLPMILLQIYLWGTVLLFVFGPWPWPLRHPERLYEFLAACHIALFFGYLSAAHQAPKRCGSGKGVPWLISSAFWATAAILPLTAYARTGKWIPDIAGGFRNPGQAYLDSHPGRRPRPAAPRGSLSLLILRWRSRGFGGSVSRRGKVVCITKRLSKAFEFFSEEKK